MVSHEVESYRSPTLTYITVKPDATPEEVKAVVNDEQGGQIFTQAVCIDIFIGISIKKTPCLALELTLH